MPIDKNNCYIHCCS